MVQVYKPECISQTKECRNIVTSDRRLKSEWPDGGWPRHISRSLVAALMLQPGGALRSSWSPPSTRTRPPLGARGEGRGSLPHRPDEEQWEKWSERLETRNKEAVEKCCFELKKREREPIWITLKKQWGSFWPVLSGVNASKKVIVLS